MSFFNKNKNSKIENAKKSTQAFLEVSEVRDGVVVLKNGNLRKILATSTVNFALKSEEEQNAIISSYQNFLNILDYPVQIIMQNRPMDITPYMEMLKERSAMVTNQLLQMQIAEYREFISRLVEQSKIMSKAFFVVVPHNAVTSEGGFFGKILHIFNPAKSVVLDQQSFETHKKALQEKVDRVRSGLGGMGLESIELSTEEIIELLYTSYNIGAASMIHSEALNRLDVEELSDKDISQ